MARKKNKNELRLNSRQEMFAQEVASGLTNADAYRIVYGQGNYSDDSLYITASRLRAKVDLRVKEILRERANETKADKNRCTQVLMNIVNSNPKRTSYTDPKTRKTKMRTPQQLSDSTADAVRIMTNNNGYVSYTFEGKIEAIRELAKINGWYEPEESNCNIQIGTRRRIVIGGLDQNDDD